MRLQGDVTEVLRQRQLSAESCIMFAECAAASLPGGIRCFTVVSEQTDREVSCFSESAWQPTQFLLCLLDAKVWASCGLTSPPPPPPPLQNITRFLLSLTIYHVSRTWDFFIVIYVQKKIQMFSCSLENEDTYLKSLRFNFVKVKPSFLTLGFINFNSESDRWILKLVFKLRLLNLFNLSCNIM